MTVTSLEAANRIAHALLYEGYLLYPYYRSSTKNRQRWTFGGIYPRSYVERNPSSDASEMQTECLLEADRDATLTVRLKFLHLIEQKDAAAAPGFDQWEEAKEQEVVLDDLRLERLLRSHVDHEFCFEATLPGQHSVQGLLEIRAVHIRDRLFRLHVRIVNTAEGNYAQRSAALLRSMISTHTILTLSKGDFISSIDPPEDYQAIASDCRNVGTFPILVGNPGERRTLLSSPIILYDYPEIAPESPGDYYDAAEIDELLALRVLTLTDDEKNLIRASDPKGHALLERTEKLTPEEMMRLHGRLRELKPASTRIGDREIRPGDRVRLRPKARASNRSDVFDIALTGLIARIESIEQTLEGGIHLSVTLDDDPGRDLGSKGIPGHRFFFGADEVEAL